MMIQGNFHLEIFGNMWVEVALYMYIMYIQYYLHSCVHVDFIRSIVNSHRPFDRPLDRLTPFLRTS